MQVAVDEFNKIQEKMKELSVARDALKMKAFSCGERIKELEELNQDLTQTEVIN
jgi:hypothetical protein